MDITYFKDKFYSIEKRKQEVLMRIQNLLNFGGQSEKEMNIELEEVCKECLRLDLRGYPIDMILLIKEKRD